ncbi:MAG TPA: hypothetical protein VFJ51_00860 [Nitrososphaeraceae archaeon]|nr:hypothetical protein [Nitrososphaeraceae archaeon]
MVEWLPGILHPLKRIMEKVEFYRYRFHANEHFELLLAYLAQSFISIGVTA